MKAILVLDKMPNSCDECEVRCTGYTAKDYAQKGIKRPSWCPLRPLPQKKGKSGELHQYDTDIHYEIGWNECIQEIEKLKTKSDLSTDKGWWRDYELYEMQND